MTKIVHTIHRLLPRIVEQAKEATLPKRPRWKRPIKDQAKYDEAVAWRKQMQAENPRPPWQGEMRHQLALSRGTAAAKRRSNSPERKARERAELEAEAVIRKVVAALELTLRDLNACRAPRTYNQRVNQMQMHNAVHHLKTKCGVKFEADEFSQKATLDRSQFEGEDK